MYETLNPSPIEVENPNQEHANAPEDHTELSPESALARAMSNIEPILLIQNQRPLKHHQTSGF